MNLTYSKMLQCLMQHTLPDQNLLTIWQSYPIKEQIFLLAHYIHWYYPFQQQDPFFIRENYLTQLVNRIFLRYTLNEQKWIILYYVLLSYHGEYPITNNFLTLYHSLESSLNLEIQHIQYLVGAQLLGLNLDQQSLYDLIQELEQTPIEIQQYDHSIKLEFD